MGKIPFGVEWRSFTKVFATVLILAMVSSGLSVVGFAGGSADNDQTLSETVYNIDKGTYYTTIQAAVDDADPGNTIEVSAGTYYENVVINKSITLAGEDRNTTIINGSGSGDVVYISADWVNVTGFTVTGSGNGGGPYVFDGGIELNNAENCTITDNKAFDNRLGIYLQHSKNNIIKDNDASNNRMAYTSVTQNEPISLLAIT